MMCKVTLLNVLPLVVLVMIIGTETTTVSPSVMVPTEIIQLQCFVCTTNTAGEICDQRDINETMPETEGLLKNCQDLSESEGRRPLACYKTVSQIFDSWGDSVTTFTNRGCTYSEKESEPGCTSYPSPGGGQYETCTCSETACNTGRQLSSGIALMVSTILLGVTLSHWCIPCRYRATQKAESNWLINRSLVSNISNIKM